MNRRKAAALLGILGLLALMGISAYSYIMEGKAERKNISVGVIVYGTDADRWAAFRQGVEAAASDLGATIHFQTSGDSVEEQQRMMKEEEKNGAEGFLIAAVDSQGMSKVIQEENKNCPVVMVETGIGGEKIPCVSADNAQMGRELAQRICSETGEKSGRVYLLGNGGRRSSSAKRLLGLQEGLEKEGYQVENWEQGKTIEEGAVLAAVDDGSLEKAVDLAEEREDVKIYGIGSSNKIVYFLDRGVIDGILFQNEFNMGYLALEAVTDQIRYHGDQPIENVDYRYVTQETVHLPENERLLYPLVQ